MIGEEGKVGLLVGAGKKGEVVGTPIRANEVNKYMWHFWGEEETIKGDFKVVGTNEDGERVSRFGNSKRRSMGIS